MSFMQKIMESILIPRSSLCETKVFYLKMKGDYYRYLAEVSKNKKGVHYIASVLLFGWCTLCSFFLL